MRERCEVGEMREGECESEGFKVRVNEGGWGEERELSESGGGFEGVGVCCVEERDCFVVSREIG
jgi:hypothetical protein